MQSVDLVCEKNGEEVKRKKGTPSLEILCSDGVHQRSGWLVLVDSVLFSYTFFFATISSIYTRCWNGYSFWRGVAARFLCVCVYDPL